MRISDWSSDVCSSDLRARDALGEPFHALVNNASVFAFHRASAATQAGFAGHFRAHVFARILLAKCFVQQLPNRGRVALATLLAQKLANPTPDFCSYPVGLYPLARSQPQIVADFF